MNDQQQLIEAYKKSVLEKDVESFLSIFDKDLHVFDMWETWSYRGLKEWRGMAEAWFSSLGDERVVVDFEDVQVVSAQEMGHVSAILTFTAINLEGKALRSLQNRLTWVTRQRGGVWKVIHEHTSSPVNHATGKVLLKR